MSRIAEVVLLHPAAQERVGDLLTLLQREGLESLKPYETIRSPWRQAQLYARGRVAGVPGKRCTFNKAWESSHQYGLAADFVFFVPDREGAIKPSWDEPEKGMWDLFHNCARRCELLPLDFEKPHVEMAWNKNALLKGHLPAGYRGTAYHRLLDEWEEKWGPIHRIECGVTHPGAPPVEDLHARPELLETA